MLEHPRPTILRLSPQHVQVGPTSAGNFYIPRLLFGSCITPLCLLLVRVTKRSETWPPTAPGIYLRLAFRWLSDLSSFIMEPLSGNRPMHSVILLFKSRSSEWSHDWKLKESPIKEDCMSLWNCLGLLEAILGLSFSPLNSFFLSLNCVAANLCKTTNSPLIRQDADDTAS